MTPYLTTSASPLRYSRSGSVSSVAVSIQTPAGWWKAPIRFLPLAVVDADLAADGAIDHRQQRRRHHEQRQAAVVGRGREAGQVADDAAADRDD